MDRVGPAVRRPSASCRISAAAMRSGAFEPFTPETMRRWAPAPADGWTGRSASAPSRFSIAARMALSASGRWIITNRPPGASIARQARIQVGERRAGVRRREDMGPRAPRVRRDANRPAFEEWRVGDDAIGRLVRSPASRRSWGFKTSSLKTRARASSPLRAALISASRARSGSISTRSANARADFLASASPTAPTPAPTSTIRLSGVPAAAARRAASVPTRWPRFG